MNMCENIVPLPQSDNSIDFAQQVAAKYAQQRNCLLFDTELAIRLSGNQLLVDN